MTSDNKSPISEYLVKLQMIITNTEFKNKNEANKYETLEMSQAADAYINAVNKTDKFESYQYDMNMVTSLLLEDGLPIKQIEYMMVNPHTIPQNVKNQLMEIERAKVIKNYVEENKYYRSLMGLPTTVNVDNPDPLFRVPEEFYNRYSGKPGLIAGSFIHEMPEDCQELFLNTEFYSQLVSQYPRVDYLKHLGTNAIPVTISRRTRDGEIMKINTGKLSSYHPTFGVISVSPDIIHKFTQVYKETHDYVFYTLRGEFDNIYANYDEFIRFLTIYLSIGNCINEFMRSSASLIHMNSMTADNLFNLYGLPSVIMEGSSMIEFLKKFRLLLMDKGTNQVYRVKDLIGYEYTDVYSLIMVKQQVFENGEPVYITIDGKPTPKQEIVFRRIGTTNEANSYFKFRESSETYLERRFPSEGVKADEYQISSGDPRWWDTKEVNDALRDMNYTLSNSKYIQLSTHISFADIWFQSVILLRGLLDNHLETEFTRLNLNFNVNGATDLSVFDAVLCLVILMNWNLGFEGEMYYTNIDKVWNGLYNATPYTTGKAFMASDNTCPEEVFYTIDLQTGKIYEIKHNFIADTLENDITNGNLKLLADIHDLDPKKLKDGNQYKIASFDFNVMNTEFYKNTLPTLDYLDLPVFIPMVQRVCEQHTTNIGETIMTDVSLIYNYLKNKLRDSRTIDEFRQVTDAYYNLFLVDPIRDWADGVSTDTYETLARDYDVSVNEIMSFCGYFTSQVLPDFTVPYLNHEFKIYLHTVMNQDVKDLVVSAEEELISDYMFLDSGFVDAFDKAVDEWRDTNIENSPSFSSNIKNNYRNIIKSKVDIDLTISNDDGPTTFAALLHQKNPFLSKYVENLRSESNKDTMILFMRALCKALDEYTSSNLAALEFRALGQDRYINILKEVISYFKSYMVEFTKDEFIILMDNILDNGGNSNMLRLYDEIHHKTLIYRPTESLALFDVSKSETHMRVKDGNENGFLRDEAIIRLKMSYQTLKSKGLPIWYEYGDKITNVPFDDLTDDTMVIANIVQDPKTSQYKAILHKSNVNPDNYYGNKRKI